eukprot:scaffold27541_cov56-Phaeocystis_antarctica.AAC.2
MSPHGRRKWAARRSSCRTPMTRTAHRPSGLVAVRPRGRPPHRYCYTACATPAPHLSHAATARARRRATGCG